MHIDETFGIIPLRKVTAQWEVYLIQHRTLYWGFPKGHPEPGETPHATAVRELKEETGLTLVRFLLGETLLEEFFFEKAGRKILKKVYYFLAEVTGQAQIIDEKEIVSGTWVPVARVSSIMTHASGKALGKTIEELIHKFN